MKVTMEMHHVLTERGDFVTDGSFTADIGLLYPTGGVNITPQMTSFRGAKRV